MQSERLAEIHAACFEMPRPWTLSEFQSLIASPSVFLILSKNGFAMGRLAGPEVELLTIAVSPTAQGKGQGAHIMGQFIESAKAKRAEEIFLEVAASNLPAVRLYDSCGFKRIGKRDGYYQAKSGEKIDALVMQLAI